MSSDNPTVSPASDAEIADTQERALRVTGIGSTRALKLIARIASEVSANRAKDETIEDLRARSNGAIENAAIGEWVSAALRGEPIADFATSFARVREALEARETIRAQAEEIESLNEWIVERQLPSATDKYEAELAQARKEIERLREALKAAMGHCDCSDYNGKALLPCTEANPCAGCYTVRIARAALAPSEPGSDSGSTAE